MGVLDRKTYRKIEYYLYHYFEIRREVEQEKEDIVGSAIWTYKTGVM